MSYLKKLENEFNRNKITLNEITELRRNYNALSFEDQKKLDAGEKELSLNNSQNDSSKKIEIDIQIIKNYLLYFFILSLVLIVLSIYLYVKLRLATTF